jgi:hypothetical protein
MAEHISTEASDGIIGEVISGSGTTESRAHGSGVPPAGHPVDVSVSAENAELHLTCGRDAHTTPTLPIQKRHSRYLPHWTREGATYAVTFRLGDSLPSPVLETIRREREDIVATARQTGRELSEDEQRRLGRLYSQKMEKYLDQGAGACWMARPEIAAVVAEALLFFAEEGGAGGTPAPPSEASAKPESVPSPSDQFISHPSRPMVVPRYRLHAWCVMPNHVHVVVEPLQGYTLPEILHSWKSFTAKQANRLLGRKGIFWQDEYYDHLVRSEGDYDRVVSYTESNPNNAGLRDWAWVSTRKTGR